MNFRACAFGLLCLSFATGGVAQQLTPRAFWPTPVGTSVLVVGYDRSEGDIVVDQSLPITGVDSVIDRMQFSFQHTFDWWGRTSTVQVAQGFADGTTTGFVDGEFRTRRTVGQQDTVARLAVNLKGAPSMTPLEFRERMRDPQTIVGASLSVVAPTGEYDSDRLINLGGNRFAIKPAVGMIQPLRSGLLLEVELGLTWFQDNDEFLGQTREQDPVFDAQLHLVRRFKPGFWGSIDANFYHGGRTWVGGVRNRDLQRNSRFGATLVFPVAKGQALRFSGSVGTVTETGGDYDLFNVSYISAF